ncbi:zinc finger SWIM domain-containing protein 1 [Protopterus annectens]|uniref:zinc finger SWIM domain-containing protein 1 n=1 Tax=Protopterus annectens TaxID=7888 RepID=UPI001CF9E1E3|nr:zinc finger SWIM domain-containing protein 1 [Protopterus annectens]
MALPAINELLTFGGSLVHYDLSSNYELEVLNFQTSQMGRSFIESPSVLLLHKTCNPKGKVIYAFIVEVSPPPNSTESALKVVHFAVPKDDSCEAFSELCKKFKEFNPAWKHVNTILVDDGFKSAGVLKKEFQADVHLSIYSIAKILQQKVFQMSLDKKEEALLLSALTDVLCTPTEHNLEKLRSLFMEFAEPTFLLHLNMHWLFKVKLWGGHKRESSSSRIRYIQDLEAIVQTVEDIATRDVGLEMLIAQLVKEVSYYCFAEHLINGTVSGVADKNQKSQKDDRRRTLLFFPDVNEGSLHSHPDLYSKVRADPGTAQGEDALKQSLIDICMEPAAVLCLNELAVTQKSVQLMGTNENDISIQLLEDAHIVSNDLKSCSCAFNQNYKLPCRHILAVLNENKSVPDRHMIHDCWKKGSCSSDGDENILDVLKSSWSWPAEKQLMKSSVSQEITRLLTECSSEEFERRYSTLRELADNWIGPYIAVKL